MGRPNSPETFAGLNNIESRMAYNCPDVILSTNHPESVIKWKSEGALYFLQSGETWGCSAMNVSMLPLRSGDSTRWSTNGSLFLRVLHFSAFLHLDLDLPQCKKGWVAWRGTTLSIWLPTWEIRNHAITQTPNALVMVTISTTPILSWTRMENSWHVTTR